MIAFKVRRCIVCACTDIEACEETCGWAVAEPWICTTHFDVAPDGVAVFLGGSIIAANTAEWLWKQGDTTGRRTRLTGGVQA